MHQHIFYPYQDYEQVSLFKKSVDHFETIKSEFFYKWLKTRAFQPKVDTFIEHSQPIYIVMQKQIEKLEFVQDVNLSLLFIDSLKNNCTK